MSDCFCFRINNEHFLLPCRHHHLLTLPKLILMGVGRLVFPYQSVIWTETDSFSCHHRHTQCFIASIVCREPSIAPESVWNPPLLTAPHLMAAVLAAGHFFIRWNCLLAAGSGRGHLPPPLRRGRTKINPANNQKKSGISMETRLFFGGGGGISNVFGQVCHIKAQEWCVSIS